MFGRILHSESKTIVGAAVIVGVLSFVSRIMGLLRDRILAGEFGAGSILDSYYAAFKLPDLLFGLIVVGALSASFIPLFTRHYKSAVGRNQAWEFANAILHVVVVAMAAIGVLIFIFAGPLAKFIAPGFYPDQLKWVATMMRIMILSQLLLSASMVFGSVLQSLKRFVLYSLAPVFYNIGIIIGALFLSNGRDPYGLAWGVVLGAFLHLAIQLYGSYKAGFRYKFTWQPKHKDVSTLLKVSGPRVLGIGLSQIQLVILTIIATTLAAGSVTIFQFAYNIQFFSVGIVGISFAIAAFPSFSEHLEKNDLAGFVRTFSSTVRQMMFLLIPLMLLFLIVRAQIVRVVVGAGEFDWPSTIATADTLAFFALSFIPQSLVFLLSRAYFAMQDTWTPLATGIAAAILGLISALWFTGQVGVLGLGIAYSLTAFVHCGLLWATLRQRVKSLDELRILKALYKMAAAGLAGGVVMQLLKPPIQSVVGLETFFGVFAQGFISGIVGWAVYFGLAYLLKSEEMMDLLSGARKKILRKIQPGETISTETTASS